jgi:hypothetical protein
MHGQTAEIAVMGLKTSELSLKQINKAEDPAAKLLEKKQQNMLSCLLIPILQKRFCRWSYTPEDTQKID